MIPQPEVKAIYTRDNCLKGEIDSFSSPIRSSGQPCALSCLFEHAYC